MQQLGCGMRAFRGVRKVQRRVLLRQHGARVHGMYVDVDADDVAIYTCVNCECDRRFSVSDLQWGWAKRMHVLRDQCVLGQQWHLSILRCWDVPEWRWLHAVFVEQ